MFFFAWPADSSRAAREVQPCWREKQIKAKYKLVPEFRGT